MTATGIISAIIIGLIIGALGRLLVRGRQHISILVTILVGIVAALIGSWIATMLHVNNTPGIDWIELLIQVVLAAIGVSEAQLPALVEPGSEPVLSVAKGNGPVNALDLALRKDLGKYQSMIKDLDLTDYRVRILDSGTEAVTRVLIESQDEAGESWTTVGVSPNIIDASFQALMDSVVYKLVKSGAPA